MLLVVPLWFRRPTRHAFAAASRVSWGGGGGGGGGVTKSYQLDFLISKLLSRVV